MKTYIIPAFLFTTAMSIFIYFNKNYTPSSDKKFTQREIVIESKPVAAIETATERYIQPEFFPVQTEKIELNTKQIPKNTSEANNEIVYFSDFDGICQIGTAEINKIDNPADNTVQILIDKPISSSSQYYLEYDLYGLADNNSVCKIVNDYIATGGMVIKINNEWTHQSERLSVKQLKSGINNIRFSISDDYDIHYQVKNVTIKLVEQQNTDKLVVNQAATKNYYGQYAYVSGFVDDIDIYPIKVFANSQEINYFKGVFEGIVFFNSNNAEQQNVIVTVICENGDELIKEIEFTDNIGFDYINLDRSTVSYIEQTVLPQTNFELHLNALTLKADVGFLLDPMLISATGLRTIDMPLLDMAMVNVTAKNAGYRCLPHGSKFQNNLSIGIQYDTTAMPNGYGPEDIRTFYYDDVCKKWVVLELDSIDYANNAIISKTNHFTDFINAILKTPELPTNDAFTPTSLKDLDYANPLAGINIMSPPTANNRGVTNLSFPIQIPAGRQGMQPQLAVSYSSDGGSGMCGVGWDINIPSITVNTKWGVPRFFEDFETEEYLVNGEQIVELADPTDASSRYPLLHLDTEYRERATGNETHYVYRVEGKFHKIIRHGDTPSNYWWEIIDKQGTRYIYGNYVNYTLSLNNVRLRQTGILNTSKWVLCEVIDIHGNSIRYDYNKITYPENPGNGGTQIYLNRIFYTGYNGTLGKYNVYFYTTQKDDINISGRYGFLEVTDRVYNKIDVYFENELIKSYVLNYDVGAYHKTILKSIAEVTDQNLLPAVTGVVDCDDCIQYKGATVHCFDYYEEEGIEFETNAAILIEELEEGISVFDNLYNEQSDQSIGRNRGVNYSVGGGVCLGIGKKITSKENSIGLNYVFSYGNSLEKTQIIDINGDGLKDKIEKHGSDYRMYKGELNNGVFKFSPNYNLLPTLPGLSSSKSLTNTLGGEIMTKSGLFSVGGALTYNHSWTTQTSFRYFEDINADGFIDVVSKGDVYFNYPDENGIPVFTLYESGGEQEFFYDECYNNSGYGGNLESCQIENDAYNTKRDPVIMWIAPADVHATFIGNIKRNPDAEKLNDTIYYCSQYETVNTGEGDFMGCKAIYPHDFNLNDFNISWIGGRNLNKGDIFYFWMHSDNPSAFDEMEFNLIVRIDSIDEQCTDTTKRDANEKLLYKYNYAEDVFIHDNESFVAPYDGVVDITGALKCLDKQSDNLNFSIVHRVLQTDLSFVETTLYSRNFDFTQSFTYPIIDNLNNTNLSSLSISEGDEIVFQLDCNSNINWNEIETEALKISYSSYYAGSTLITEPLDFYPKLHAEIYANTVAMTNEVELIGTDYTIIPSFTLLPNTDLNGNIVLTIKNSRKMVASVTIPITNGTHDPFINYGISFSLIDYIDNILYTDDDILYLDYYSDIPAIADYILLPKVHILMNDMFLGSKPAGFHAKYHKEMNRFGNLYRGWGQFSYHDVNNVNCNTGVCNPINTALLDVDVSNVDDDLFENFSYENIDAESSMDDVLDLFENSGFNNLTELPFAVMRANTKDNIWTDFCQSAFISKNYIGAGLGTYIVNENATNSNEFEDNIDLSDFSNTGSSYGNAPVINKISKSANNTFYANVSSFDDLWSSNSGLTASFSNTKGISDMRDMNGDGYPDVIDTEKIQYTTAYNGFLNHTYIFEENLPDYINYGEGSSNGLAFGVKGTKITNKSNTSKKDNLSGSFGIGANNSNSKIDYIYLDINGDGLPDRIDTENQQVAYNIGYGFADSVSYNLSSVSKTSCVSAPLSLNIGFNKNNYSLSGGIGGSGNTSRTDQTYMDINNDGLIDICYINNGTIIAYINTGSGFYQQPVYAGYTNNFFNESTTNNVSSNISGTMGVLLPTIPPLILKLVFTGYLDLAFSFNKEEYRLDDLNGDGAIDYVFVDDNKIKAKFGIPKKSNILKKVVTPGLSSYMVDYAMDYPTADNPNSKWVMSSLIVNDGAGAIEDGADNVFYTFEYEDGKHHRIERESFGFETVKTKQWDSFNQDGTVYRSTEEKFHINSYLFNGLKKYECNFGTNNEKYVEKFYYWANKDILTGEELPPGNIDCFGPYYPAISTEDVKYYEGSTTPGIVTRKQFKHGAYGNIIEYTNYNNINYSDDDIKAVISYSNNVPLNLLELVAQVLVLDHSDNLLRRTSGEYSVNGDLTKISQYNDSNWAHTDMTYDSYGNITYIEYPNDINGDRINYYYSYDDEVKTYIIRIMDTWHELHFYQYDYKLGKLIKVNAAGPRRIKYTYLPDGRIETITGPNELDADVPYTIRYGYWNELSNSQPIRWALTRHYDPINVGNEFLTVNISDGLGRIVQSKKTTTVHGSDKVVVSGPIIYDEFGRQISISQPVTEDFSDIGHFVNYTQLNALNPSIVSYDVLDRTLRQIAPDNTEVNYDYSIEDNNFKTTITDQNNLDVSKFVDARGLQTKLFAPYNTITQFEYSNLGQLISSTDPEGNITAYKYDLLGRMYERNHPDANRTSYTYDLAGNVTSVRTENLGNLSETIYYVYTNCRLTKIEYPINSEMNVYYEYGDQYAGTNAGKLIRQQDASGVQEFYYGKMGELIKNIHTFVVPAGEPYTFQTEWKYDSWNRLEAITYPDGELVRYLYDNGGKLRGMDGEKDGEAYRYIESIHYNKYGSRKRIDYGNGATSQYTYNEQNLRLENLKCYENGGVLLQNIEYTYDYAGNIMSLFNNVGNYAAGQIGGKYLYKYKYDDLYRLIDYRGDFYPDHLETKNFNLRMDYTPSGNIAYKRFGADKLINGHQTHTNYEHEYLYNDRPHSVTYVGNDYYKWDENGNMIYCDHNHHERFMCWDEENRLSAVRDHGELSQLSAYLYDAGGERTWKLTGQELQMQLNAQTVYTNVHFDKTLYASPLMVMTEQDYTKHYFIEGERVCSKIGSGFGSAEFMPTTNHLQFITGDPSTVKGDLPKLVHRHIYCVHYDDQWSIYERLDPAHNENSNFEENQYFYHPDHLGSSSFITDFWGRAEQHIQYAPFGELIVSQRNSEFDSRYKFTAKEHDTETDYTYFGARYYDSDASIWLSVDPMASERSWVSPYNYCQNNPVGRVDPTGALDDWYESESGRLLWSSESTTSINFNEETFSNIATGDCLPDEYQSNGGANLIISGHQSNGTENRDWDRHASQIYSGNSDKSNVLAIASNSDDFIHAFEVVSENFGKVNNAAIRSHAGDYGLGLGSGNYFENFLTSEMSQFASKVNNTISFAENAQVFFMGCNTDFLSRTFTTQTGVTSIGSIGLTGPQNPRGSFLSTTRFNKYSWSNGLIEKNLGTHINVKL